MKNYRIIKNMNEIYTNGWKMVYMVKKFPHLLAQENWYIHVLVALTTVTSDQCQ